MFCKGVLRNLSKITGNTCARVSFFNKAAGLKKETLTQVFCEISNNTFYYRTPPVTASDTFDKN